MQLPQSSLYSIGIVSVYRAKGAHILTEGRKFSWVIGIDQTGAVTSAGKPKPLFAARLDLRPRRPSLQTNLRLASLTRACLTELAPEGEVLVVVDSVLSLPAELGISFDELLRRAKGFRHEGREFGRDTAAAFFRSFLKREELPHRQSEKVLGANSVFLTHPFQRNVGCGSFRVLKEVARDERWFDLWPHDSTPRHRFLLAEGYPSFTWRWLLATKTRHAATLKQYLRREFPKCEPPRTPDDADAAVLALGGHRCLETGYFEKQLPAIARREGWIAGLAPHQIIGFHRDEENHWVADLACGHGQHMRHTPPWMERPWVLTEAGRRSRVGTELECRRCADEAH